jgi:hypothetical protein
LGTGRVRPAAGGYEQARVRLENAERNARRAARLLASKAIASEAADATESQFQESRAALLAAKSSWESARLDLEFTEVRAPIDGRASRALMTAGNYVNGASSLLTTLVSVDPVYVYADVDENSLLKFNALANERKAAGDEKIPVELELADEDGDCVVDRPVEPPGRRSRGLRADDHRQRDRGELGAPDGRRALARQRGEARLVLLEALFENRALLWAQRAGQLRLDLGDVCAQTADRRCQAVDLCCVLRRSAA